MRSAILMLLSALAISGCHQVGQEVPKAMTRGIEPLSKRDLWQFAGLPVCRFFAAVGDASPAVILDGTKLIFRRDGKLISLRLVRSGTNSATNQEQASFVGSGYTARTIRFQDSEIDGRSRLGVNIYAQDEDRVLLATYGERNCSKS